MPEPLPIDPYLNDILARVRERRAVVVTAAPGAGKTTRVPPVLAADGPVILLQPRRVAARAIARRIAAEQGWTVGREVGWHVRFERQFSADTRLLVATEGILTARFQQDPLLASFRTIVLDEFHERSIHADLGLALARQAWLARDDLRIVVMSATLDSARVAAFLNGCPVVDVPGRTYPVEITYRPGVAVEKAAAEALPSSPGAVLCFLPGAPEIRRAMANLERARAAGGFLVLPLHGSLDADEQDAAIKPSTDRRVILATNIAETTLTVPDVVAVVDSGYHKVARYDADRAIDSLDTERIPQDCADQRAGRAGRTQAGRVVRLWEKRDRLRPTREPEIARVDLTSTVLEVLASGADPLTFDWYEPPPAVALQAAVDLLRRLDAIDAAGTLTPIGRDLNRLPLHPRLSRFLIAADGAPEAARACALLADRHAASPRHGATTCDLLSSVDREERLPPHVMRVARDLRDLFRRVRGKVASAISEADFRRAVLAAYPDRVARRRAPRADRFVMSSGTGARLAKESGVHDAEFVVAVDVSTTGGPSPVRRNPEAAAEALIRLATQIEREWLPAGSPEIRHSLDESTGTVKATRSTRYYDLVLEEHPVVPDPEIAARLIADAYVRRGPSEADAELIRRLRVAGVVTTFDDLVRAASNGVSRLSDIDLDRHLPDDVRKKLGRHAPPTIQVPSGRDVRLEYRNDDQVVAAVKLQELFGLAETPRIGPARTPVTFELLAPNGRPVQVTSDLRSFWTRGYVEVRKELRARYPKHPWPEDPWTAPPTAKPKRKASK
ncbi:MAG TPA: ATP-dependent helicase C-terminal domain-containing protein [Vicinamibacterales bacterium]|nr:ATP-dependent helicase C-terminal domain-containing protein [Vicinamibacterales bacterium]